MVRGACVLASLLLALAGLVASGACSSFSGTEEGADGSAPTSADASSTDCDGAASCAAPDAGDANNTDAAPPAQEPLSLISPYQDGGLTYPFPISWTLAAENDALIHYTTDGTDPTAASSTVPRIATIGNVDGGVIKWTVGSSTKVHSWDVRVDGLDGGSVAEGRMLVENFRFASTLTPIASVPRGVTLIGASADISVWNGAGCPTCALVVTIGIDKPASCIQLGNPGVFPGFKYGAPLQIAVPSLPGVYPIHMSLSALNNCGMVSATDRLSDLQVGVLVVTP